MRTLLTLIGRHPGEAIAIALLLFLGICIGVGIFLAWWAGREAQKDRPQAAGVKHRRIS